MKNKALTPSSLWKIQNTRMISRIPRPRRKPIASKISKINNRYHGSVMIIKGNQKQSNQFQNANFILKMIFSLKSTTSQRSFSSFVSKPRSILGAWTFRSSFSSTRKVRYFGYIILFGRLSVYSSEDNYFPPIEEDLEEEVYLLVLR